MKKIFERIQKDKILFTGFSVSFVLIILTVIYILVFYKSLPPFLPIFNQLPWGEARLGEKNQVFLPLATSFLIFIINYVLSFIFYEKLPLISRLFCLTSAFIAFLTFIFIIRTIQLII